MGLDMYLEARKYVNKIDWNTVGDNNLEDVPARSQFQTIVSAAGLDKVASKEVYGAMVGVNVAYWRKANQIHGWFVDNVQRGEDDCGEYFVSKEQLTELLELCKWAMANKDAEALPPREGFFFGSTEIDEGYWYDIENTISQLDAVLAEDDLNEVAFFYHSSW